MSKNNDEPLNFSEMFKDAKRVVSDQYVVPNDEKKKRLSSIDKLATAKKMLNQEIKDHAQLNASVKLSDNFEAHWPNDKPLKYFNSDIVKTSEDQDSWASSFTSKDILKKLSLGYFPPDIEIDLHGQTSEQAKAEILAAIFEAKKRHFPCLNIIHGHGKGTLKHKVPNWLVQHPDVAAFIQAPRSYGGKAGLLVLIGIDFKSYKPEF